jgi:hypothetical protein
MYIKVQLIALINMTLRLSRPPIDIVNRVLMKRILMITIENVIQPRRMRQSKDAIPKMSVSSQLN